MLKSRGRDIIGKVIVSEETGRKFGVVGDLNFVAESGELLNVVLTEPTKHTTDLALERDEQNRLLVPPNKLRTSAEYSVVLTQIETGLLRGKRGSLRDLLFLDPPRQNQRFKPSSFLARMHLDKPAAGVKN